MGDKLRIIGSILLVIGSVCNLIILYKIKAKNNKQNITDEEIAKQQNIPEIEEIKKVYDKYVESHLLDPILIISPMFWLAIKCSILVNFDDFIANYVINLGKNGYCRKIRIIIRNDLPENNKFLFMSDVDYLRNFEAKPDVYTGKHFSIKED